MVRRALGLIVEGALPDDVRRDLSQEVDLAAARDRDALALWQGWRDGLLVVGGLHGAVAVVPVLVTTVNLKAVTLLGPFYGVVLGLFLVAPLSRRLEALIAARAQAQIALVTGLAAIADGESPRGLEDRMRALLPDLPGRHPADL